MLLEATGKKTLLGGDIDSYSKEGYRNVPNELSDRTKEISRQNTQSDTCILLTADDKM